MLVDHFGASGAAHIHPDQFALDGRKGTATLEVGGEREDCVAFRP